MLIETSARFVISPTNGMADSLAGVQIANYLFIQMLHSYAQVSSYLFV